MGLLLPAVQSSRESARMTQCRDHLRQIGVALHNYQASDRVFPTALLGMVDMQNGSMGRFDDFSPYARLLPYLDEPALYRQIDFTADLADGPESVLPSLTVGPSVLICPSDSMTRIGMASYSFSMGALPAPVHILPDSGAFPGSVFLQPADFPDGLSNTAGVAEKLVGAAYPSHVRSTVKLPSPGSPSDLSAGYWVQTCSSLTGSAFDWDNHHGMSWLTSRHLLYNHIVPPNSRIVDCASAISVPLRGLQTARSEHSGLVNVMMMDGHVRSVSDSIDNAVWWSVGTRQAGDAGFVDY